jgi:hypothetical protein
MTSARAAHTTMLLCTADIYRDIPSDQAFYTTSKPC